MSKQNNNWSKVAKKYDRLVGETGDIHHKTALNPLIFKLLGSVRDKHILDLACGNGYFSRKLAKKYAIVIGVDSSKKIIDIAKSKTSKKLRIQFLVRDSDSLNGLKNNFFDYIVSNISFHDIQNIRATFRECARTLKKNGKIIFSIPHPAFSLGERKKDTNGYYRVIREYMSPKTINHPMYKEVKLFHRPIEYYLQQLFKYNFLVSGFHEVTVKRSKGKRTRNKELLIHQQEIPAFLIIKATFLPPKSKI